MSLFFFSTSLFKHAKYVIIAQEDKNKNKTHDTIETGDKTAMDYKYLETMTSPTAAAIIEDGNALDYKPIDPESVDELARGAVILGAETIDAPFPDGIIIYIKQPAGGVLALVVETEADESGLYELIRTEAATIQEGIP